MSQLGAQYRVGVDIGGTFTDIVLLGSDGSMHRCKVASTPEDYTSGIVQGLEELIAQLGIDPFAISAVLHGTTVATNAVLEGRGARTALITTRGFRDVLEMRRLRIPLLYDLQYSPPQPLVPRRLRFEVEERIGPKGDIWRQLDTASVRRAGEQIAAAKVDAVAITLINSYANPDHERAVRDLIAPLLPAGTYITLSSDVLAEIREYERTSTTVVNAYVGPIVRNYLKMLVGRLRDIGLKAPLQIMQSSGGMMGAEDAIMRPAYILESGPAAGVIASAAMSSQLGLANVVSFDMGGTTAKAALIENGMPMTTTEYEVGAGINISSKLVKGGGHAVKLPIIDISEIGAGGGSVVSVDALGSLKVGPRSAGSNPGPACYARGGNEPTFTDAVLTLGYLNPDALAGGRVLLQAQLARNAIAEQVAAPLGITPIEAAWGTFTLAAATMTRAVKAVSTYRGRDPRDFALIAFGGNGPVAAVAVARALQMARVLVPPAPGVFSAAGLLFTDNEHLVSRTIFRRMAELDAAELAGLQQELEARARAALSRDAGGQPLVFQHYADLRYSGQAYELTVPIDPGGHPEQLAARFHAEHARTYGHSSENDPTDLINLKVVGRIVATRAGAEVLSRLTDAAAGGERVRTAYFGPLHGECQTPVLSGRGVLSATPRRGPLIVEEYDATCVVPPDCIVSLDRHGNIDIALDSQS